MKFQGFWALTLCSLLLAGCTSAPVTNRAVDRLKPAAQEELKNRRQMLVGTWYGEATTNEGQTRRWLRQNYAEGTYKLTIRDYNLDATYLQQVEVGNWGVSGPIYFTIMKGWQQGSNFRAADPTDPYYYDAYEITQLTPVAWVYRHVDTQLRFVVKRVEEGFQLPGEPVKEEPAPQATKPQPAKTQAKKPAAKKPAAKKPTAKTKPAPKKQAVSK